MSPIEIIGLWITKIILFHQQHFKKIHVLVNSEYLVFVQDLE
jgi:hypothetical protein